MIEFEVWLLKTIFKSEPRLDLLHSTLLPAAVQKHHSFERPFFPFFLILRLDASCISTEQVH